MGFAHFDSDGLLIGPSGEPLYVVGINYVASYICTNFWEDFRAPAIEKDLDGIQALGLNAVRIPVHWGFAEPEIGVYSETFFQRFDAFLDMAGTRGILVMPWFLVGIATKSYDFPFRNGRSFFTGEMLDIEERHLKAITGRYRNDERILLWDICDEPEYFSFNEYSEQLPYKRPVMARWVKTLADAIRSVDANHLVTLGYGAIATQHFGIHVRDAAEALDLMVVTAYPGPSHEQIDRYRNNYFLPYNVRFNTLGKPVLSCEAPGSTSVAFSEEVIGNYFRVALYGNLLAGASGALPWVYNDFQPEIWHEKPLEEATFEPSFGIVTTDGRLKPSGAALAEFARFAKEEEIGACRPPAARTAILVPRRYYEEIEPAYKKLYTAFILAKASVDAIDFLWEDQDPSPYRLVLVASTRGMTTSAWDRLRRFVEAGGTILCIHDNRPGLSVYFNEIFGVETITTEKDHGYEDMAAREAWGGFRRGERLAFAPNSRSEILRVQPRSARVLFTFDDGLPAFLVNGLGRGKAFLATRPLEDGLLDCRYEEFLESRCFDLHAALAEEAGVLPEFSCPDRRVEVGVLEKRGADERLIVCINHDTSAVSTSLRVRGEERALELAPAGVKVFKVEGS